VHRAGLSVALLALCLPATAPAAAPSQVAAGRALFDRDCLSCHGPGGRGNPAPRGELGSLGVPELGPRLVGVGAAAARLYLTTGYMPLRHPHDQPSRSEPRYTDEEIDQLVAYVASLGRGPPVPTVDPTRGDIALGQQLFAASCAGCHQAAAAGGMVTGAIVPSLQEATPEQIAEAIRVGPYLMPRFGPKQLDRHAVDSIARYVVSLRDPQDPGGWSLGHLGPVAEGAVAWLLAGSVLVLLARALGKPA
jgi:ubiquinol-cytochrome c reductase cytochrome c subunit